MRGLLEFSRLCLDLCHAPDPSSSGFAWMWHVSDGINKRSSIQNEKSVKDRHKLATLRGESLALCSWRTGKGIPDVAPLNCAVRGQQMGRNAINEKGRGGDSTPPGTSVPGLGSDNPM